MFSRFNIYIRAAATRLRNNKASLLSLVFHFLVVRPVGDANIGGH